MTSNNGLSPDAVLKGVIKGLNEKFEKLFKVSDEKLSSNQLYNEYKKRFFLK